MNYSVILPTLNENGHIVQLIDSISTIFVKKDLAFEIIIVDDNSEDGTIQTVERHKKENKKIQLIVRSNLKKNLAESINEGIINAKYENVIWMDADFQHPPQYLNEFINEIHNCDVVIASRFLSTSGRYFKNKNFTKDTNENQSYLFNKLCNFFLFKDVTDFTSGFICLKKDYFKDFRLQGFYGDYFVNLITYLKKRNAKIIEIPFTDSIRATGYSKTLVKVNIKYIYTCFRYFLTLFFNIIKTKIKI
ncbi:MAG: glycosyltransferase [Pelagibacteraceae bacterium]|jgi:dolichol-phosphate mannosyltransferase|nr:glycosyltransferase [Pelagibacteraceae bacterium]